MRNLLYSSDYLNKLQQDHINNIGSTKNICSAIYLFIANLSEIILKHKIIFIPEYIRKDAGKPWEGFNYNCKMTLLENTQIYIINLHKDYLFTFSKD